MNCGIFRSAMNCSLIRDYWKISFDSCQNFMPNIVQKSSTFLHVSDRSFNASPPTHPEDFKHPFSSFLEQFKRNQFQWFPPFSTVSNVMGLYDIRTGLGGKHRRDQHPEGARKDTQITPHTTPIKSHTPEKKNQNKINISPKDPRGNPVAYVRIPSTRRPAAKQRP